MLTDFGVVPHLVARSEAEACLAQVRAQARRQGVRLCLTLPAVLQALSQVAVLLEDTAVERLLRPNVTTAETRALRLLVSGVPEEHQEVFREALGRRGRLFELEAGGEGPSAPALAAAPSETRYSQRVRLLEEASQRRVAEAEADRTMFHVESRARGLMRLEDRRHERQLLELSSAQPVRGPNATLMSLVRPQGSALSARGFGAESSVNFTMSSLLALDAVAPSESPLGGGAAGAAGDADDEARRDERQAHAQEFAREVREFERLHMKALTGSVRPAAVVRGPDGEPSVTSLTQDLTQVDMGEQRAFGRRALEGFLGGERSSPLTGSPLPSPDASLVPVQSGP